MRNSHEWFKKACGDAVREAYRRLMRGEENALYLYYKPYGLEFKVASDMEEDPRNQNYELVTGERISPWKTLEQLYAWAYPLCSKVSIFPSHQSFHEGQEVKLVFGEFAGTYTVEKVWKDKAGTNIELASPQREDRVVVNDDDLSLVLITKEGTARLPEDPIFGEVISSYSRRQALEDGMQADANIGDLAEVTRQHFKWPVYITRSLWNLMEKAVENRKYGNDWKGVWHDICWMGKQAMRISRDPHEVSFKVIITGTGRTKYHTIVLQAGPRDIDDPSPALTFMLPEDR